MIPIDCDYAHGHKYKYKYKIFFDLLLLAFDVLPQTNG